MTGLLDYVEPHKKVSREMEPQDLKVVVEASGRMKEICNRPRGLYLNAFALAHAQVEADDPLRFFVRKDGELIINPEIIKHSKTTVDSKEACMSYPDRKPAVVQRWNVCEVTFMRYAAGDDGVKRLTRYGEKFSGRQAFIIQHEIDHMDGKYIYDGQ
jgi:peptide deformylase